MKARARARRGLGWRAVLCALGACMLVVAPLRAAAGGAPDLAAIRSAARSEHTGAQLLLGLAYLEGRYGLRRDPQRAVYWLRRAARDGQPYAQLRLGELYEQGVGVAADPAHAVYWWRRSAGAGNAQGQLHLGEALLAGHGVARDPRAAARWLTKSARQGNAEAQYRLGRIYREGYGVARDTARGNDWLSRAAAQGQSDAVKLLHLIEQAGKESTLTYQQSAEVLERRARSGDARAQYELGLRYESGAWDVPRDATQALRWLRAAAGNGNRHAMSALAHIYDRGLLGQAADPQRAAYWRHRARARH